MAYAKEILKDQGLILARLYYNKQLLFLISCLYSMTKFKYLI